MAAQALTHDNQEETLSGQIGNTPLVRLRRIVPATLKTSIFAKLELANPGGSVKDRCALAMVEDAEKRGLLKPGISTIVEASSGNTGIGLALLAASRGYKLIITIPEKMSLEKRALLKAFGAKVIVTPNAPHSDPRGYIEAAKKIARETPHALFTDQCSNQANALTHTRTGREIFHQMKGRKISALIAGAGTGGTISGAGRELKKLSPGIKIVGVDPEGSILSGGRDAPYKVEGIGYDFIPATLWEGVVDEWVRVSDRDAFLAARRLARKEGILAGGSSGAALFAALKVAQRFDSPEENVVVILPDTGERYLSTVYNDDWLVAQGLARREELA